MMEQSHLSTEQVSLARELALKCIKSKYTDCK